MSLRLRDLDYSVVQQCMHCGMCLPHCPTYRETGRERSSPRGRIALMRAVADGEIRAGNPVFGDEMSFCLGCLACQTACPAAVDYEALIGAARAEVESAPGRGESPRRTFYRALTLRVLFRDPRLLRAAATGLRWYQKSPLPCLVRRLGLVPPHLRPFEPQAPKVADAFSDRLIAEEESPRDGAPRFRVGVLTGCVQDIAYPEINRDTVDVLLENGCAVFTPRAQHCCGSLHAHNGDPATARTLARLLIDQFAPLGRLDAIISNAGGCGSHLQHFSRLLADDPPYAEAAREWDRKLTDVHAFLVRAGFRPPGAPAQKSPQTPVTYHPSCHLLHGQRVAHEPLTLLASIPGIHLVPLADADTCCGSAGIYTITQPEFSTKLQKAKADRVRETGARVVATANPGCLLQIQNAFGNAPDAPRVVHPVTLLAEAYRAARPR